MEDIKIQRAQQQEWPYIEEKLQKYGLDADNTAWQQFFVARYEEKTVAFGRIIDHGDCLEIASVGVDYYHRGKGIGCMLLSFLVEEAGRLCPEKDIYGVTDRPGFIGKAGFKRISVGPEALEYKKQHKCLDPSRMSMMKWEGS